MSIEVLPNPPAPVVPNLKFTPMGDRIVVEREGAERITSGGIHIPDEFTKKSVNARILKLGTGIRSTNTGEVIPFDVKVGDRVVLTEWAGTELRLDGKEYRVVTQADILGIIG